MVFDSFIASAAAAPYQIDGASFDGMDCFGFVQLWHQHLLGVDIVDRNDLESTPEGFQSGYECKKVWVGLTVPADNSVIVMRSLWNGTIVPYGHCGMYRAGLVYHIEAGGGFQAVPISNKRLSGRISDIRIHEKVSV